MRASGRVLKPVARTGGYRMPKAARKLKPAREYEERINLDAFVADETDTVYVRVIGDAFEHRGIGDGDLLVIHRRAALPNESMLVRYGEVYSIIKEPDEPKIRREQFFIVGRERVADDADKPDEVFGVVAFVVHRYVST